MKVIQSWKRNMPSTVSGESITITITCLSFIKEEIDQLEASLLKGGTVISQTQSGTSTENFLIHLAVELIKKGKTFNEFIKNELTKNVSEDKLVKIWNAAWFAVGMTEKVNKKVLENMDE